MDSSEGNDCVKVMAALRQFVRVGAFCLVLLGSASRVISEEPSEPPLTPYQTALLKYKSGHFEAARTAIVAAEKAKPGDPTTEILKARILTELGDFDSARKTLEDLNGNPALTPELDHAQTMAFGDMCLRRHSFFEADKFYESLLGVKPNDPDLMLKIIYARIGANDLIVAEKYASKLKPSDPDRPCYYFATAALDQATGKSDEAEGQIQVARTIFGILLTNRYLEIYLQLFAKTTPSPAATLTPPAVTNAAPVH